MEIEQVLMLLGWFVVGVLALALIVMMVLGIRVYIVQDDQRYVVYRLGRFARIAGPGLVPVMHRFENIGQVLDVREQPVVLRVDELQFNGVFLGYTVDFWCTNDPAVVAGQDRERLVRLLQFDADARRAQMETKVREAMMQGIRTVQSTLNTPDDANLIERLLPVLPGQRACEQLAEELRSRLQPALRSIGMVLSEAHPVNISRILLSPQLIDNFGRGITLSMLKEQMPDAPADTLAQLLSSIEGREMPNIRKVVVERPGERNRAPAGDAAGPAASAEAKPAPAEAPADDHAAEAEDWRVLKSIPRSRAA
jgi:regulator of protease activity HflC (stomatin/prohibitin superfamily)